MSATPEYEPDARRRILDAAAEAFMAHGFANATIDDIAREVGATKGLVYYHFRSKFDIFLAVYEEAMGRVRDRVELHAHGAGTGRDRLVAMAVAHLVNLMTDLAYHHVVHQAVRGQVAVALKTRQRDALQQLNELRSDYEQLFRGVLADGVADRIAPRGRRVARDPHPAQQPQRGRHVVPPRRRAGRRGNRSTGPPDRRPPGRRVGSFAVTGTL